MEERNMEEKDMEKKLQKLETESFIIIRSWSGLGYTPGSHETVITNDKKIYYYSKYSRETSFLVENKIPMESISDGKDLGDEKFEKLVQFVKENVVGKKFEDIRIRDAYTVIFINYENQNYRIMNNEDIYSGINDIIEDN